MSFLGKLWKLANGDLLGREEVHESEHPYFGKIVYFGRKGQGGYWEAELPSKAISLIIPASKADSLEPYVGFCHKLTGDMTSLFQRCKPAFESEFKKWSSEPFPADWEDGFILDGITLPVAANENNEWSVCYFVPVAERYFTAQFEGGAVSSVVVDG